jgi:hypothetical protein
MVFFGKDLFCDGYEYLVERYQKLDYLGGGGLRDKLPRAERPHTQALQELAKKAVSECLEFDLDEINIEAQLNENAQVELNNTPEPTKSYEELPQYIKDEIHKRILINAILQGASTHIYISMHHLVSEELKELNKDLPTIYSHLTLESLLSYYVTDYSAMMSMMGIIPAVGSEKVEYEEDQPKVSAHALTFPVLCQEIAKGVLEVISFHSLECFDEEELATIYSFADRVEDEPRLIQIGAELWRRMLRHKPKDQRLPDWLMWLFKEEPEEFSKIMESYLENNHDSNT